MSDNINEPQSYSSQEQHLTKHRFIEITGEDV